MLLTKIFDHPFWQSGRVASTWGAMIIMALLWVLFTAVPLLLIGAAGFYGGFGGTVSQVENYFANLMSGGYPNLTEHFTFFGILIVALIWYFITAMMYTAGVWTLVRNAFNGEVSNPVQNLFQDGWRHLGLVFWTSVRIFCYIFFPLLFLLPLLIAFAVAQFGVGVAGGGLFGSSFLSVFFGVIAFGLLFWLLFRAILAAAWLPMIFMSKTVDKNAIIPAKLIARKNWGSVLLLCIVYGTIISLASWGLRAGIMFGLGGTLGWQTTVLLEGVDFLVQVFIFSPLFVLTIGCLADLMLRDDQNNPQTDV